MTRCGRPDIHSSKNPWYSASHNSVRLTRCPQSAGLPHVPMLYDGNPWRHPYPLRNGSCYQETFVKPADLACVDGRSDRTKTICIADTSSRQFHA